MGNWAGRCYFPAHPAPADLLEWRALVDQYIEAASEAVARSQEPGWLESSDPGYEDHGFTWRDALEFLTVHSAYRFGRIVLLRQLLGAWPPAHEQVD